MSFIVNAVDGCKARRECNRKRFLTLGCALVAISAALGSYAAQPITSSALRAFEEESPQEGNKNLVMENSRLRVVIEPAHGARITSFYLKREGRDEVYLSQDQSRFGGWLDDREASAVYHNAAYGGHIVTANTGRVVAEAWYTPKSGNWAQLRVSKRFTLTADATTLLVEHQITNHDTTERYVAPWIRNIVADYVTEQRSGANHGANTSLVVAQGVFQRLSSGRDEFMVPARDWIARVPKEPKPEHGTVWFLYDYQDLLQLYTVHFKYMHCLELIYHPVTLAPAATWQTRYTIAAGGPLRNLRYASSHLGADLCKTETGVEVELTATADYGTVEVVLTPEGGTPLKGTTLLKGGETTNCTFPPSSAELFTLQVFAAGRELLADAGGEKPRGPMISTSREIRAVNLPADASPLLTPWQRGGAAFQTIKPRQLQQRQLLQQSDRLLIWGENSMERLFEGDAPDLQSASETREVRLSAAGGEREALQFALRNRGSEVLTGVRAEIGAWEGPGGSIPATIATWHALDYIETKQPSSYRDYPVGRWPDPFDAAPSFQIEPGQTRVVWVSLQVPRQTRAGLYTAPIVWYAGTELLSQSELKLQVYAFDLPQRPAHAYDAGLFYGPVEARLERVGCKRPASEVAKEIASYLISRRMSPRGGHGTRHFTVAKSDAFAAEIERLKAAGVRLFPSGGFNWGTLQKPAELQRMKAAEELLERLGVLHDSYFYAFDEIHREQFPSVIERCRQWHAHSSIPLLAVCYNYDPALLAAFDIWGINQSQLPDGALSQIAASGVRLWSVNSGIDSIDALGETLLECRLWSWRNFHTGYDGNLMWSVASWNADPWLDPFANGANCCGLAIYPAAGGFVSSARLEACADALDDFDYLVLLRERIEAAAKCGVAGEELAAARKLLQEETKPEQVATSDDLLRRRHEVATWIERLTE